VQCRNGLKSGSSRVAFSCSPVLLLSCSPALLPCAEYSEIFSLLRVHVRTYVCTPTAPSFYSTVQRVASYRSCKPVHGADGRWPMTDVPFLAATVRSNSCVLRGSGSSLLKRCAPPVMLLTGSITARTHHYLHPVGRASAWSNANRRGGGPQNGSPTTSFFHPSIHQIPIPHPSYPFPRPSQSDKAAAAVGRNAPSWCSETRW
jgi:hypothetical protein